MNRWTWTEVSFQLLRPIDLSSLRLHLTMTHSSTFPGLRFALFGVTVFPAAENTRSDFKLAAGNWGDRYLYDFLPLKFCLYPSRPIPVPKLFCKYPTRPIPKSKTSTRRTLALTISKCETLYPKQKAKLNYLFATLKGAVRSWRKWGRVEVLGDYPLCQCPLHSPQSWHF